jgi:hypothetical protein
MARRRRNAPVRHPQRHAKRIGILDLGELGDFLEDRSNVGL